MDLSDNDVRQIADLVSSRLDPNATDDEIRSAVTKVVEKILSLAVHDAPSSQIDSGVKLLKTQKISKMLVLSALGPDKDGLVEKLKAYIDGRALRLLAFSNARIENLRSLIALIDFADYSADLNSLKFDLISICEQSGYKAIVQDSAYYGIYP